jgi:hypothetical protein
MRLGLCDRWQPPDMSPTPISSNFQHWLGAKERHNIWQMRFADGALNRRLLRLSALRIPIAGNFYFLAVSW